MIRLAVRCSPERAEIVLAELMVLAPNGVEEETGPDYVEYAIYGAEGELPELGEIEVAAGDGLVEVNSTRIPDDWADRWRDFHQPISVGERLCVRPSWTVGGDADPAPGSERIDILIDPGQAFGTGAHPTTRLCLELLLDLVDAGEAQGALTDLGTGSGVLAIAAAKLGWGPVSGYDHEAAAIEATAENAAINGVTLDLHHTNLREGLPPLAPTTVANMTSPVLKVVAAQLLDGPVAGRTSDDASGDVEKDLRSVPAVAPKGLLDIPRTLICSGLLTDEPDEVAAAFAPAGFVEAERRFEGDWAAILLRLP